MFDDLENYEEIGDENIPIWRTKNGEEYFSLLEITSPHLENIIVRLKWKLALENLPGYVINHWREKINMFEEELSRREKIFSPITKVKGERS